MTHQHRPWGYSNSADGNSADGKLPDWDLHEETLAVRAGLARSGFGETGGAKELFKVMDALKVIDISNNLGDSKSLITHPASTTHLRLDQATRESMGITDSLGRLSVGLEHSSDLIKDLQQALR
jgi:O-succinylhomoserine sulfhydrylase